MVRRVQAWGPAILWGLLIFFLSTDAMSGKTTWPPLERILRFLFPAISHEALAWSHVFVRKAAHVIEYFVFALLLDRGFRRGSGVSVAMAPFFALAVAALYSATDEIHQTLVPSRGGSFLDCGWDTLGAGLAALLVRLHGNPLERAAG